MRAMVIQALEALEGCHCDACAAYGAACRGCTARAVQLLRDAILEPDRDAKLESMVRRLRSALDLCADPIVGWPSVECADAYEASRTLVQDADAGVAL